MISEEAKPVINELAAIELTGAANLTVAAFVEKCCEGDGQADRLQSAASEINQCFGTHYNWKKIREWMFATKRGEGRVAKCPSQYEKYMQSRLLLSITPGRNDRSLVSLMKILNVPHEAAEAILSAPSLHSQL